MRKLLLFIGFLVLVDVFMRDNQVQVVIA